MGIKKAIFEGFGNVRLKIKKFLGLGWKSKIGLKRATFSISINKLVAEGCGLKKGGELYSYLAEDEKGRKMIATYLDGRKMLA